MTEHDKKEKEKLDSALFCFAVALGLIAREILRKYGYL